MRRRVTRLSTGRRSALTLLSRGLYPSASAPAGPWSGVLGHIQHRRRCWPACRSGMVIPLASRDLNERIRSGSIGAHANALVAQVSIGKVGHGPFDGRRGSLPAATMKSTGSSGEARSCPHARIGSSHGTPSVPPVRGHRIRKARIRARYTRPGVSFAAYDHSACSGKTAP